MASDNCCVLQAVLDASADLGRPLSAQSVERIVHIIARHGGWPGNRAEDLLSLIRDDLDVLALIEHGYTVINPIAPVILFYQLPDEQRHCEYLYPPFPEHKELNSCFVLRPKEDTHD